MSTILQHPKTLRSLPAAHPPLARGLESPVTQEAEALSEEQRRLVEENLALVGQVAGRWRLRCRSRLEFADLQQVGALGLMEAARRYDPSRVESFAGFARERVRGAICDFLRELDPLSRKRRQAVRQLEEGLGDLQSRNGRQPEDAELAGHLGWRMSDLETAKVDVARLKAGIQVTLSDEDLDAGQHGRASVGSDACDRIMAEEMREMLKGALDTLPERHRMVLALYYYEEMSMGEIGQILDVTESRVSQIHSAAITSLRARIQQE